MGIKNQIINKKLNIAFYSITPLRHQKEATTITIISLAKELQDMGHKIIIITEKAKGLPKYQEISGVPVYRKYKIPYLGKILSHPLTLKKIQKRAGIKFDIIHSFSATPLFVLSNFISKIFSPKAKTLHSLKSYSRKNSKYFFFLLNLVNHVTVPTQIFAKKLTGVKENKIKTIYSPINLTKFYPKNKEELKIKYGYKNKKIIFYYGSLHEHKGVDNLIKSLTHFKEVEKDFLFIFSPRYKNIESEMKLIKSLGVEKFTKFVFDIPIEDYVNLADVVVLPYNNLIATEGNPSCMLEAMACKTPVITANLPELQEIVKDKEEVIMVNSNDHLNLAKEISHLINNKPLVTSLTENAFEKSKEFDVKKISKELLELYRKNI